VIPVDGDFLGPLDYSAWFPWAGLGLLVLVAGWCGYVVLSTRRRPPVPQAVPPDPGPAAGPDLARLRREYLQRIDAVAGGAAAGTRSGRSAHQELSLLLRSFVRDASGLDATRMTLAELRALGQAPPMQAPPGRTTPHTTTPGLPALSRAVAALYPAAFGPAAASGVPEAADTAREVIRSWT
jgi:hypothetical protein